MDRLQAMAAFVRVVETGSFSGAARQIGVGQPAISKTIAQLEDRLQVRLLVRSTHGLTPTDAGLRFYERAKTAIHEADEAELEARGAGAGLTGQLRVSAATTFARLLVVPRLPEFLTQHPDLEIDIVLDDRVIDLVSEGVDISLRMGQLSDSSAVARRLASGRRSVIATPAYLEQAGIPAVPAELATHEAIVYSQLENNWIFRKDGTEASVAIRGRVRVSAAEGIRAAVLADMGLTVNSDWMFAPELESGVVVRLLKDWELPPVDLWAVFPTGRLASAKARAFADFVETATRQSDGPMPRLSKNKASAAIDRPEIVIT
ncbi:LysR family transcriptional regulator [Bradyrhizobium sp. 83002]|uniref:LysR family transcriptional regulator n=1 Tax=Bradyrhizobium aeschynomenes TaxID=2734909 RepID=UPI0015547E04|nr:LysR family transcriptional regulator [Bradyrhizobium aeschynomenes]NPU11359.1 LysR family transcriptional regulator [Bradyrhizobium aeschynomenes]